MTRALTLCALLLSALLAVAAAAPAHAQTAPDPTPPAPSVPSDALAVTLLPESYRLDGFRFEWQGWNNCSPATLTGALSFFGYPNSQSTAAAWLKPNPEDKNVTPWEMAAYVNTQVPGTTRALVRYGGDLDLLRTLVYNGYPVIVEVGYDPDPQQLGWMGHYLLVRGYDRRMGHFITNDTYLGENKTYNDSHLDTFWRHFNRVFMVVYDFSEEEQLLALLGGLATEDGAAQVALDAARADAIADGTDAFAWFNMGTSFVALDMMAEATVAYDQARQHSLPWRMMWYQFGPFQAYNAVGRYDETLALARANLNDGGGQYIEETYYYAGVAREAQGDLPRALSNYREAARFNPNFRLAVDARDRLVAQGVN